jgi:hypothetical protein
VNYGGNSTLTAPPRTSPVLFLANDAGNATLGNWIRISTADLQAAAAGSRQAFFQPFQVCVTNAQGEVQTKTSLILATPPF